MSEDPRRRLKKAKRSHIGFSSFGWLGVELGVINIVSHPLTIGERATCVHMKIKVKKKTSVSDCFYYSNNLFI